MKNNFLSYNTNYDDLILIEIDDYPYFFESEITIFQACLEKNVVIPRFCYHSKLSIAGNCRICSIEEKKSEKVILSCSTLIDEETEVFTNTFLVLQARENIIEYLLSNHPLDCPICDQGGECDLQEQTMLFGGDLGRFYENFKRAVEDKNFSPLIKFSLNRCIHCARCSRFFSEISNSFLFSLLGRGLNTEISFYEISSTSDELSGNVIDLCPVGALTSKPYSFVGRIWEYTDIFFVDIFDDFLSNLRVDVRGTSIIRILPDSNFLVNDDWISDKIRFSYDSYSRQRLTAPFFIFFNKYFYFSWVNSLFFFKKYFFLLINFYFLNSKKNYIVNFVFDRFNDIFSSFLIKNFSSFLGLNYFFLSLKKNNYFDFVDFRNNYISNLKLIDFENNLNEEEYSGEDTVEEEELTQENEISNKNYSLFFINLNLRYESPVYNVKIKKILKNNLDILIFNFGFYNYKGYTIGYNFLSFFKNLIHFNSYYIDFSNLIFLIGTFFYYNLKLFSVFIFLKSFFLKIFNFSIFFNYTTFLANRVTNCELNILNNNKFNFFNYNINPTIFYSIDLNNYYFNFSVLKNSLVVFQGHHANSLIKYSNIVLPSTVFIERSDLLINTEGYLQIFFYNYFKYKLDGVKDSSSIILILFKFFTSFLNNYSLNSLNNLLNKISPIFFNKNNENFIDSYNLLYCTLKKINNANVSSNIIGLVANDFYISDTIGKYSIVMSLCAKKYTLINDFKFFFRNVFSH